MSRIVSDLKLHFLNWRQWELNPVVVKELRQAVRSWAVTGTLILFLLVLLVAAIVFFVTQSFEVSTNQRLGADIFTTFSVILTGASLLFIPLYVGVRVANERQESDLDLLYISTLTPQRIIRGKFFCGAYVAVLFFSACMPFMTFTNLLRGVDLPSVFFVLLCQFLVVCCAVQVAIFLACLPISKILKILVGLGAGFASCWLVFGLTFWTSQMMQRGVGSMMSDRTFWAAFLTVSGVALSATLLLYFLSVALISPLSANRAVPVRIYITVVWILGLALSLIWSKNQNDARLILPWAFTSFWLFGISLVVVVSNQDTLSVRVHKTVPERMPKRALAFLFYNGAAGGLVWLTLLLGATYLVTWVMLTQHLFVSTLDPDELISFLVSAAGVLFYMFGYALLGLFVHRQFFRVRSARLAGIFAVMIPAAWALVPVLFFFFLNRLSTRDLEHTQLGNLFNIVAVPNLAQKEMHLYCSACVLAVMLLLNLKWFLRQVRKFQPLRRATPAPASIEAPPIIPAAVS